MAEIRSLVEADSAVTKSLLAALVRLLLGVWSRVDPYSPDAVIGATVQLQPGWIGMRSAFE